jgi:hypothetical protein
MGRGLNLMVIEVVINELQRKLREGMSFEEVVDGGLVTDLTSSTKESIHEVNMILFALLAEERNRAAGY